METLNFSLPGVPEHSLTSHLPPGIGLRHESNHHPEAITVVAEDNDAV